MNSLYFECNSGISGDMAVAAMLDAGADEKILKEVLETVPLKGFYIKISRVKKNGIDCCDFNVILDSEHENHDHDMEYLFANKKDLPQNNNHSCSHEHIHHHEHSHEYAHEHVGIEKIIEVLNKTKMSEWAKELSKKIFEIIAQAESKAHGIPVEKVHFHEVGAIDSIIDVIALSVCFENIINKFDIKNIYVPKLYEGKGFIRCQHGIIPVPVPAVLNIVAQNNLNLSFIDEQGEFVTPTGAAFVASVITSSVLPKTFTVKKIGLGAGKRNYNIPSITRLYIIEENEQSSLESSSNELDSTFLHDEIIKMETNIDDSTGESLGFLMEELFANGALDVNFIACMMKKNRPANLLTVLCKKENKCQLEKIIFSNSTSIGIRYSVMQRTILKRKIETVKTEFGEVNVKVVFIDGKKKIYPEYESVKKICKEKNVSFDSVIHSIGSLEY